MSSAYIKGKPNTSWWTAQVRKGIEFRKRYARETRWSVWRDYYRGVWAPGVMPSNLFFKMLRTITPRIYFRNPSISIQSAKPGPENLAFAHILERIDNKLLRRMRVKNQIKKIVQDAFKFGTGIGKLGYGAEFTPTPDLISTSEPVRKGEKFEYNALVQPDMPWFMRVPTGSFIVPTGLDAFEAAPWCAMWIRRPLEDVMDDPRFKNTASLKATSYQMIPGADNQSNRIASPVEMIDLVEVRDKKRQQVFVFAPFSGGEKVLFQDDDDLQWDNRLPYYPVVFNDDDEVMWGTPDSAILEPLQLELNETKTVMMKHRRLSLVRILAEIGSISPEEAAKLVGEDVSPIVWCSDLAKAVQIIESGGIPKDLFLAEDNLMRDSRETVGFGRNQFGEFKPGSSDTTAMEAQLVAMASEIRIDERRDMLADMLVELVTDMHKIIFERWDEEMIVDVAGPGGQMLWVRFKGSMLSNGRYEINIDPDSSVPETKGLREQKAIQIFNMLNGDPLTDQVELRKYLFREMTTMSSDSLLKVVPQGVGTQENPMDVEQLGSMLGMVQQQGEGPNLAAV